MRKIAEASAGWAACGRFRTNSPPLMTNLAKIDKKKDCLEQKSKEKATYSVKYKYNQLV